MPRWRRAVESRHTRRGVIQRPYYPYSVRVTRIDERSLAQEGSGGNFVVFIYEGGDEADVSWSVDSYLLADTDLPQVWRWLRQNLPVDSCWSLGVVVHPEHPTPESKVKIDWILGADVLASGPPVTR